MDNQPYTLRGYTQRPAGLWNRRSDYSQIISDLGMNTVPGMVPKPYEQQPMDVRAAGAGRYHAMQKALQGRPMYPGAPQVSGANRLQSMDLASRANQARQALHEQVTRDRYDTLYDAVRRADQSNRGWKGYEDYIHGEEADLKLKRQQMDEEEEAQTWQGIMNGLMSGAKIALTMGLL